MFFKNIVINNFKQRRYIAQYSQQYTTKNILGIAHPKHTILLLVNRKLEGNSGYFAFLVASNEIYCLSAMIFSN